MNKSKEMMMITAMLFVLNGAAHAADFESLGVGAEENGTAVSSGELVLNAAVASAAREE